MTRENESIINSKADIKVLRRELSAFQRPSRSRSIWQLINTLIPYALLWVLAWRVLEYSFWLALPLMALASGFMMRTFIIFHDCGHGSFFRSSRVNRFWGVITGMLTFTPYYFWRRNHSLHHATSGNLDKRGFGDVWTMTVDEYRRSSKARRLKYRLYRSPWVMFFLGPLLLSLVTYRFVRHSAGRKDKISVYGTDAGIILMASLLSLIIGFKTYLLMQFLILYMGFIGGVWLFYIQHQFEGVYWAREEDWDFPAASLMGASFYKLPLPLNWFSGNIGYHHIHHLHPRIPNYNLPKCQKQISLFNSARAIRFFSSLKSLRYRLWDERKGKLVGFREARTRSAISSR